MSFSRANDYSHYTYHKSGLERWGGLDVEITVDKDWDKRLSLSRDMPSIPDKEAFLKKILCLVSNKLDSPYLYLSRITIAKPDPKIAAENPDDYRAKDHYKIWYFKEELSTAGNKPYEFISLPLSPEIIQEARVEKCLESEKSTPYPVAMTDGVEDKMASILVEHLSAQVENLIAAESQKVSGLTAFKLLPLKGSLHQALEERKELLRVLSKDLTDFLAEAPSTSENKTQVQRAKEGLRNLKTTMDDIDTFLRTSLAREEERRKEEEQSRKTASTYDTLHFSQKRPRHLEENVTIRVDSNWSENLPLTMTENEKIMLLNKLIAHVFSDQYRKSLTRSADRFYTDLYISKAMMVGENVKAWFSNTSTFSRNPYQPISFELTPQQLKETPGVGLRVKQDEAYADTPELWANFLKQRDNDLREGMNQKVQKLIETELAYIAGVEVHLNPRWDEQLSHLSASQKQELLNKMIYLACLDNEKKTKGAGRATQLYVSQVVHLENNYKIWFVDPNTKDRPILSLERKGEELSRVDLKRDVGKFKIEPVLVAIEEDPVLIDLNNKIKIRIQEEVEVSAAEKLEIDFFDQLSSSQIDRRNKLDKFQRTYKQGRQREQLIEDGMDPEVAAHFNADSEAIKLKKQIKDIREALKKHITSESDMLAKKDEILAADVAKKYATIRFDLQNDKSLFTKDLAKSLADTITDYLVSVANINPNKKAEALKDFYNNYHIILGLNSDLATAGLAVRALNEIVTTLDGRLRSIADRDILQEIINAILNKDTLFPSTQKKIADLLKSKLRSSLVNGAFRLTDNLVDNDQVHPDFNRMELLVKKERGASIKAEREKLSKEISGAEADTEVKDEVVAINLDSYQQKIIELEKVFARSSQVVFEKRERQRKEQQAELLQQAVEVNRSTEGDFAEVSKNVAEYITYLNDYFKIKPSDDTEKRKDIIMKNKQRKAEGQDIDGLRKIEASEMLLSGLEEIYQRIKKLTATEPSLNTLEENKSLLASKIKILAEVETAFARASFQMNSSKESSASMTVDRGAFAKLFTSSEKKSPKILVSNFFDTKNITYNTSGLGLFKDKSQKLKEKEFSLKPKSPKN